MVFSSLIFLFLFLPAVILVHTLLPFRARNTFLLLASLVFYAWGEQVLVLLMLLSILSNYTFALAVQRYRGTPNAAVCLRICLLVNLGVLAAAKYSGFIADNLNVALDAIGYPRIELSPVQLPIGISFYTFQAISYVIDVYRGEARAQKNPIHVGLYIALFPQLIAGPIVRYGEVAKALITRVTNLSDFAYGVERFIIGLAKKVLVANTVAVPVDAIFALPEGSVSPMVGWLGVLGFSIQLYFDFSGYSDMAIGLGRMLGFHFNENFNYPYTAQSITEFWRRWHISLSSWFRDYVYIPLGGNRGRSGQTYVNLCIVFFLCGLWHGASWNFVIWGLFHGLFLVLERLGFSNVLVRAPNWLRHVYVLAVVMAGWVLFRSDSMAHAAWFGAALMWGGQSHEVARYPLDMYLDNQVWLALVAGTIGSIPFLPWLRNRWRQWIPVAGLTQSIRQVFWDGGVVLGLALMLVLCLAALASGSHNPFIYFRF